MISEEQKCPLCGEGVYGGEVLWACQNDSCFIECLGLTRMQFKKLTSQISRIKQQAKQEVFDELEYKLSINCGDCTVCVEGYDQDNNSWTECIELTKIKKKHGVK